MTKQTQSGLEHTAYLTSCERAMFPEISRDIYARHWIPKSAWRLLEEFLQCRQFSPMLIAARNRYFLETIETFFLEQPGILINVAAGLSSYPFLLGKHIQHVEIDSPHMINHKSRLRSDLEERGLIPERAIEYAACDLNAPDAVKSIKSVLQCHKDRRAFILFEGIVYYLLPERLYAICDVINTMPFTDSASIGFVYWDLSAQQHPFLADYLAFVERISGIRQCFRFHSASDFEYYLGNYKQRESGCFRSLVPVFGGPCLEETVFTENYVLLGS